MPQPLLGGIDDGSLTQAIGLALHVDEALERLRPPLLDSEEVPRHDGVVVVSLEVLSIASCNCSKEIFSASRVVYQVWAMPVTAITKLLAIMALSPPTDWIAAPKLLTKALGSVFPS